MKHASNPFKSGTAAAVAVFLLTLSLSSVSRSQTDPHPRLDSVLKRLEKRMAGITSVSSRFIQKKKMEVMQTDLVLKGSVHIEKDKFAWHVSEPIRFRMVIDGDRMTQWDAESGSVQKVNLAGNPTFATAFTQMRRWLDGDYQSFKSEYTISLLSADPVSLKFIPREGNPAAAFLQSVTVSFRPDESYIDAIRLVEKSGDTTLMLFKETRLNQDVPEKAWQIRDGD